MSNWLLRAPALGRPAEWVGDGAKISLFRVGARVTSLTAAVQRFMLATACTSTVASRLTDP